MTIKTSIDDMEVAKFAAHADVWWERDGPLKTLHDINPTRLEFIQKYVLLRGIRMLDLGCGGGILTESLAQAGAQVVGLDVEAEALLAARAHASCSAISLDYVCSPVELFDAEPFDCITCMELLEHVTDPEMIISHAFRLLKPGGLLILSTLNRTAKAYATVIFAAEYLFSLLPRQTHDYDKFIRPSELAQAVRKVGFDVIGLSGMRYNPFTRTAMLCQQVDVNYFLVAKRS